MYVIHTCKWLLWACLAVILAFTAYAVESPGAWLVFFDANKADLVPEAQRMIKDAAAQALGQPDYRLEVIGHDDTALPDQQSLTLSQERATKTAKELVKFGVPANRIFVGGVGSKEPLVPTAKGVREPQNRFVKIQFVSITETNTKVYLQQFK